MTALSSSHRPTTSHQAHRSLLLLVCRRRLSLSSCKKIFLPCFSNFLYLLTLLLYFTAISHFGQSSHTKSYTARTFLKNIIPLLSQSPAFPLRPPGGIHTDRQELLTRRFIYFCGDQLAIQPLEFDCWPTPSRPPRSCLICLVGNRSF